MPLVLWYFVSRGISFLMARQSTVHCTLQLSGASNFDLAAWRSNKSAAVVAGEASAPHQSTVCPGAARVLRAVLMYLPTVVVICRYE